VPRHDYTTVGHVTVDVLAESIEKEGPGSPAWSRLRHESIENEGPGSPAWSRLRHPLVRRPGGTAFYSALQAARLGLRARILTKGDPREIEDLLAPYREELDLTVIPAECTTTLQTVGVGQERHQRLLAWAGPIVESVAVDTAILHLAPVARETPHAWVGSAELVGLTPQGLVREWNAAGEITLAGLPRELLPERCDAWVLSEREQECCAQPLARATAEGAMVAITAGPQPTELQLPGGAVLRVPVPPIEAPVDDLGAGDVFAAAFFIALHEGRPPMEAAAFANAAAAVRIAGIGPEAIGGRDAIAAQLTRAARPAPPR
jgi:sugar/nucleoside kinase (ribokinase family)